MSTEIPSEWLVGHRMYIDNEFSGRLAESAFTTSEWDIIMSVVSFAITDPTRPEEARLRPVADELATAVAATEDLPDRLPDARPQRPGGSGEGVFERLSGFLDRLGGSADSRQDRIDAAEQLIGEYAEALEIHLKQQGHWPELCERCVERG